MISVAVLVAGFLPQSAETAFTAYCTRHFPDLYREYDNAARVLRSREVKAEAVVEGFLRHPDRWGLFVFTRQFGSAVAIRDQVARGRDQFRRELEDRVREKPAPPP